MLVDKQEVLRYLGHKGQEFSADLMNLVDDGMGQIQQVAKPLSVYKIYDIAVVDAGVHILGNNLILPGRDIVQHLQGSSKCAIMAATLGVGVDQQIRLLEIGQMTKALILDACATAAIEAVCDEVQEEIREMAQQAELRITFRYSPGYGDLPITLQKELLNLLGAYGAIGLTCTETHILTPRKSVTAIIGLQSPSLANQSDQDRIAPNTGCSKCLKYDSCMYRREGISCVN